MVFSLSVLQHYAMSSVNRVCHLFRSAMIMPWTVCPSSVFKNWSKLPNSKWNTDGWCSRVHSYLSGQKVWGLPQCFGNGLRVYNYRSRQKVWGLLQSFGNGRRVYNYQSGQKVWGPLQYFGNGRLKPQGESVSFRMTKTVQHRSQSTSEQMSHSNADQCVLWYLQLPLCNCFSEVVVSIWSS